MPLKIKTCSFITFLWDKVYIMIGKYMPVLGVIWVDFRLGKKCFLFKPNHMLCPNIKHCWSLSSQTESAIPLAQCVFNHMSVSELCGKSFPKYTCSGPTLDLLAQYQKVAGQVFPTKSLRILVHNLASDPVTAVITLDVEVTNLHQVGNKTISAAGRL